MHFSPNLKSLKTHEIPDWYNDAKLGIFIHWGLYSVPAYAPTDYGDITETVGKYGFKFHFKHNPYAEWYQNSLRTEGEDYINFHTQEFGKEFPYEKFADIFNESIKKWNPNHWAEVFKNTGAKYVVLGTKHHEGFTLWRPELENPNINEYYASRDIVAELSKKVRNEGLEMGYYYSGGLDWSFNKDPIYETCSMIGSAPQSEEYGKYVDTHFKELIDKYKGSLLWNDISYPLKGKLYDLISYFYNTVEHGVVNDRWTQIPAPAKYLKKSKLMIYLVNKVAEKMVKKGGFEGRPPKGVGDYSTPEYSPKTDYHSYKWEACRGIGRSFGYNQMEKDEHYIPNNDLIFSLVDIVSKNGNLLLNIGPDRYGNIPELQMKRLNALGDWLKINGEGIYQTRPWRIQALKMGSDIQVRFTQKETEKQIFCFVNGFKSEGDIAIQGSKINPSEIKGISALGTNENIQFSGDQSNLKLHLSNNTDNNLTLGLKIQL